jgi:hypothetical protein
VERTGRAPMGGAMGVLVWAAVTLLVFAVLAVVAVGLEVGETDKGDEA